MFCRNCGKEIDDKAYVCPHCGVLTSNAEAQKKTVNDSGSAGWGVLVGLILFLIWKSDRPKSARSAGIGALISVILYAVLIVIEIIIVVTAAMSSGYGTIALLPALIAA